ncbi:MAG TPA: SoxR reducing system RseC family protein [Candidatus Aminicenantes bacterium]|nr:SoxR reducing system RseC family protein [Candidatus Aminicenantes bacterium]
MKSEEGRLVRLEGEWAWVEPAETGGCEKCRLCHREGKEIRMRNRVGARVGARVRYLLDTEEMQRAFLRWNVLALSFLLGGLFLGYLAGKALGRSPEAGILCGALLGLAAAIPALRRLRRPQVQDPVICDIVKEES